MTSRYVIDSGVVAKMIRDLFDLDLRIAPSAYLLPSALTIARTHSCTVYDSLYLALAEASSLELVTADSKLYNAVKDRLHFVRLLSEFALPVKPAVPSTEQ